MPNDDVSTFDMTRTPIYRSVPPHETGHLLTTPLGDRRSKNVPAAVDNVWEWARPRIFPSRRSSAFGSPNPALAQEHGPTDGTTCRVWVKPPWRAAQLPGVADARGHPDIPAILRALAGLPSATGEALSTPLLEPEEVADVLGDFDDVLDHLASVVGFWRHARLMAEGEDWQTDPTGEYFFEAPYGYVLTPVDR